MKRAPEQRPEGGAERAARLVPSSVRRSHSEADDPRLTRALEEYLAALEEGQKLDRQEFLERHPDITEALAKCLDGLEFIRAVAPRLHEPAAQPDRVMSDPSVEEFA